MAPKRAAKKAAPPPPPAESSDETQSHSRSEESEDEEAIAESSIPARTPASKNTPAPPQKGDEEESSDEDDEEEEEEEDQPARAAPKNQPPPQQNEEDSDTSGDDDGEEEAAPPEPAPKKEAAALKPTPSAAAADEAKKPGAFHRIWSTEDEVRILEALAAHQKQHGTFPQPEALINVLAGKLDNPAYRSKELQSKVKSLRHRYLTLCKRGEVPSKKHDRQLLDLSKMVWDGDRTTTAAMDGGHKRKGFEEMCELYPYLAEEVQELERAYPGMCKREFGKMDNDKARAMDEKIKKQRVVQIRVEMRRADLFKEVTKALVDLVDA